MVQTDKKIKKCRIWQWLRWTGISLAVLLTIAVGIALVLLSHGVSSNFLAEKIQNSLNNRFSGKIQIRIANASLILDDAYHLSIETHGVGLNYQSGAAHIEKIGQIRVAVAPLPLLKGQLQVRQLHARDLDITLPDGQGNNFFKKLPQDGVGRVDFDAVSNLVFSTFAQGMETIRRQGLSKISVERIRLNFLFRGQKRQLEISKLMAEIEEGSLYLEGTAQFDGQVMHLTGTAQTEGEPHFSLTLRQTPIYLGNPENVSRYWDDGQVKNGYFRLKGLGNLQLDAIKSHNEQKISLQIIVPQAEVELGSLTALPSRLHLYLEHKLGDAALQILPSQLAVDSLQLTVNGQFAPMPLPPLPPSREMEDLSSDAHLIELLSAGADMEGKYSFQLLISEAQTAHIPESSSASEAISDFSANISGSLATLERQVVLDTIYLQMQSGNQINGQGAIRFSAPDTGQIFIGSQTPEVRLELEAPFVTLPEIKKFWPVNLVNGARRWFLRQVASGDFSEVRLELDLPMGLYQQGKPRYPLGEKELKITGRLDRVHSELTGNLPPIKNFSSLLEIKGQRLDLRQGRGMISMNGERQHKGNIEQEIQITDVAVSIIRPVNAPALADMNFHISGQATPLMQLVDRDPIQAGRKLPLTPSDMKGQIRASILLQFPLTEEGKKIPADKIDWNAVIDFDKVTLNLPAAHGSKITQVKGRAEINQQKFSLRAQARIDDIAATIEMAGNTAMAAERDEKITLQFDDEARKRLLPTLSPFISGLVVLEVGALKQGIRHFNVNLQQATLEVPWLGWKKGLGIAAQAQFNAHIDATNVRNITIEDFSLKGEVFQLEGRIEIRDGTLSAAQFSKATLNRGDDIKLTINLDKGRYLINVTGKNFDMRSFIKSATATGAETDSVGFKQGEAVDLQLNITGATGFNDEFFTHFKANFKRSTTRREEIKLTAISSSGKPLELSLERQGKTGKMRIYSEDGGALLRFANYYDKMYGGMLELDMKMDDNPVWDGSLNLRNFQIVDDPRLERIVASPPHTGGKSLNDVTKGKINASRLDFDHAFGQITRGKNFLLIDRGIVRGSAVGASFQGIVYDSAGNVSITGTFMPAYGLNRMFSGLPLLGNILGNGRDRGLIGITFKIDGKAKDPRIIVNPLSLIAPGVFRQIFEFQQ